MKRISYSAVVLDEKSRSKLLSHLSTNIPNDWKIIAHHMTINLGELKPEMKSELGKVVTLRVTKVGISDKAFAVGVEGFPSKNDIPHITIAVNTKEGGKPVDSKRITNWQPVQFSLELTGKVEEVGW